MVAQANDRDRALLFGARRSVDARQMPQRRPPMYPTAAPPSNLSTAAAAERDMMENMSNSKVDGLRGTVGQMRHLALDLGSEVKRQNTLLDGMSGTFDNAGDALGRTMRELKRLASSGSAGHLCALFTFAFLFLLLVYLLLR